MRIVVDLQAVQAANKARGIGRYATSLTRALINEATQHEIVLVVNGQFPNALAETRAALRGADLAPEIRVWSGPSLVQNWMDASPWQREAAALIRDAFIESLRPDVILVLSLFEGFDDPAVTSVPLPRRGVPTAIVLFDLIPFVRRADYLSDTSLAAWYDSKIEHLRHADLLLAISESSRQEAIDHLGARPSTVVNISGAADATFRPATIEPIVETDVRSRLGLSCPFVMYTGGIDPRKNIQGLIRAYASLPIQVRLDHQLAIVCAADQSSIDTLELVASDCGLLADEVMMTGYVSDADLATLYNLCKVFVFPSIHEGFGLPALEAMSCGRAVIGSETTSLPEIIKLPEAMFDPFDLSAIAQKLAQALTDDDFRRRLETNSQKQALRFSWDRTARRALDAMEALHAERTDTLTAPLCLPPCRRRRCRRRRCRRRRRRCRRPCRPCRRPCRRRRRRRRRRSCRHLG